MAFAKGQESTEGSVRKLFKGVGSSYIVAINPNKAELERLLDRTLEEEPVYLEEKEESDKKIKQLRIVFYLKPDSNKYLDADGNKVNSVIPLTFYLRSEYRKGSNSGKYQVIDEYGRTAWATEEEINEHKVPMYSSGPANITKNYRKAISGEEDLTNFLIAYLNIQSCQKYVDGKWILRPENELAMSLARLDHIQDYFKGDISEIQAAVAMQPENTVKVCYGIKTNDDGRMFQTVYSRMFLKNFSKDYSRLAKNIEEAQTAGAFSNCEFDTMEFREYKVESTDLSTPKETESPFTGSESNDIPW